MQKMKEKLHPVIDIEKRLITLETRPVETSISNVSFAEETPATCSASSRCFEARGAKARVSSTRMKPCHNVIFNFATSSLNRFTSAII